MLLDPFGLQKSLFGSRNYRCKGLISIPSEIAGKLNKEEIVNIYLNLTGRDNQDMKKENHTLLIC